MGIFQKKTESRQFIQSNQTIRQVMIKILHLVPPISEYFLNGRSHGGKKTPHSFLCCCFDLFWDGSYVSFLQTSRIPPFFCVCVLQSVLCVGIVIHVLINEGSLVHSWGHCGNLTLSISQNKPFSKKR